MNSYLSITCSCVLGKILGIVCGLALGMAYKNHMNEKLNEKLKSVGIREIRRCVIDTPDCKTNYNAIVWIEK